MLYAMLHTATIASHSFRASAARAAALFMGEDFVRESGYAFGEGARDDRGYITCSPSQSVKLPNANPISKRIALLPRSPRQPLNWQTTMVKPGGSVELA